MGRVSFHWDDPLLLEEQLTMEEKMVRDAARDMRRGGWRRACSRRSATSRPIRRFSARWAASACWARPSRRNTAAAGLNYVSYGLIAREVERVDSGYRSMMSVQSSLVMVPIDAFGSEAQKQKYLPQAGARRMDRLLRPDRARPRLRSRQDGRRARARRAAAIALTGAKTWISNAPIADVFVVWAKTDDGAIRGFILEKGWKGLSAPAIHGKVGLRASITGEIVMDDVFVPEENLLPGVSGLKGPFTCLEFGALRHRLGRARRGRGSAGTRRASTCSTASSSAARSPPTSSSRRSSPTCRPRSRWRCRAACGSDA